MKKTALITSSDKKLTSVFQIQQNIFNAYKSLSKLKTHKIKIDDDSEFKKNILYDFVVIVDLSCITYSNFKNIFNNRFSHPDTVFIFHLMGDFFRKKEFFINLEEFLINRKVLFIPPSDAYTKLISKCIKNFHSSVIPFPIDFNKIKISKKDELNLFRKKQLKLEKNDYVFVYAGRVSNQKNILELIKIFHSSKIENSKLLIVGNLDNLETPTYFEKLTPPGNLFLEISQYINENQLQDQVRLIGPLAGKKLYQTIQSADQFISLSLYHDEDFGFFPIEAMYLGLNGTLTDWGGYKDLKFNQATLSKIKISLNGNKLVSKNLVLNKRPKLKQKTINLNRKKIIKHYSIRKYTDSINNLITNNPSCKFKGFTTIFKKIALNALFDSKADIKFYQHFYGGFWK